MRLRAKLFVLLLVLALLPLGVVRGVDAVSLFKLGRSVAAQAREQLDTEMQRGLERAVASFTGRVEQEERLVRALLELQALAVERRLAAPDQAEGSVFGGGGVWLEPRVFEAVPSKVAGLEPSDRHFRRVPTTPDPNDASAERLEPVPVSYVQAVVFPVSPPGGTDQAAQNRASRAMAGASEDYRDVFERFPEAIHGQFTTLTAGLHSSYPGKGGYPAGYDPFTRPWYVRAAVARDADWTPPVPDAITGRTMLTMSMPVYGPDGEFTGVTAIDVPLDRLLERQRLGRVWGEDAAVSIVTAVNAEQAAQQWGVQLDGSGEVLAVFASSEAGFNPQPAGRSFRFHTLRLDDPRDEAALHAAVAAGEPGTRNARVAGREMKLSWGNLISSGYPSAVVVATPLDRLERTGSALQQQIEGETTKAFFASGLVVTATVGLVLLVTWRGSRSVTRPVIELAEAARAVADGDLDAHVELNKQTRKDEIGDMARAFNDMVPKLRDRLHMRSALDLAMEVQQSLLPQAVPDLPGWDVAGRSDYCDETGGDYYDYLELTQPDARHLGVALGDVTGHGIAAALLMCTGRALLRSRAETDGSLAELIGRVNDHLTAAGFSGRFMTLFYLALRAEPFALRYVSAGHDPAIVYDRDAASDDGRFTELAGSDLPLGIEPGWAFTEYTCDTLPPRAVVVLGTDGIWEARNRADAMYGKERLMQVIRTRTDAGDDADAIAQAILDDVHHFRGAREQLDDITLVVLRRVGTGG